MIVIGMLYTMPVPAEAVGRKTANTDEVRIINSGASAFKRL